MLAIAYFSVSDVCPFRDLSLKSLFPTGGIASQMLRDIPYAVVTLLTYEHLKRTWKPRFEEKYPTVPKRSWDLLVGGLAGGIGSYVTNPSTLSSGICLAGSTYHSDFVLFCSQWMSSRQDYRPTRATFRGPLLAVLP